MTNLKLLSLAAVGQLHKGDRSYYKSWSEVEVPWPSDFPGWNPKTCLDLRGTWQMNEEREARAFWMRRTFQVSQEQISLLKYLQIASAAYHSASTPVFDVWVNGKKLASTSDATQCFPVGDALRVGENQIVFNTLGTPIAVYCFLGPEPASGSTGQISMQACASEKSRRICKPPAPPTRTARSSSWL